MFSNFNGPFQGNVNYDILLNPLDAYTG